jgi:hypothetical protein
MVTESELIEAIKAWQAVAKRPISEEKKHAAKMSSAITLGEYIVSKGIRTQPAFLSAFKDAFGADASESAEYAKMGFALAMFNADLLDEAKWDAKPLDIRERLAMLKYVQAAAYGNIEEEMEKDQEAELALARKEGEIAAWTEAVSQLKEAKPEDGFATRLFSLIIILVVIAAAIKVLFMK